MKLCALLLFLVLLACLPALAGETVEITRDASFYKVVDGKPVPAGRLRAGQKFPLSSSGKKGAWVGISTAQGLGWVPANSARVVSEPVAPPYGFSADAGRAEKPRSAQRPPLAVDGYLAWSDGGFGLGVGAGVFYPINNLPLDAGGQLLIYPFGGSGTVSVVRFDILALARYHFPMEGGKFDLYPESGFGLAIASVSSSNSTVSRSDSQFAFALGGGAGFQISPMIRLQGGPRLLIGDGVSFNFVAGASTHF